MAIYDWTASLQQMAQATAPSGGTGTVGNMADATAPYKGISASATATGGGATSGIPRETAPVFTPYQYGAQATQYPQYMQAAGERGAQQSFQQAVNSGVVQGNSVQGYQHALDNRTTNIENADSAAGQQALAVGEAQANENDKNNRNLALLYHYNVLQRGQDVGYQESLNRMNSSNSNQTLIAGSNRGINGKGSVGTTGVPGVSGGSPNFIRLGMDPNGQATGGINYNMQSDPQYQSLGGGVYGDSSGNAGGGSYANTPSGQIDNTGIGSWGIF